MLIALQNDPPTNQSRCYTAKHGGDSPQAGRLIKPFEQQEPRRHPLAERFSTPGKYDPPHLERLKADLALGRAELPRVRATVSARPASARVQRALTSLQTFDGIEVCVRHQSQGDGRAPGAPATFVASVRWYQLDPVAGRAIQEGSFAVPGAHYCYPAIVPDVHGNAALIVGRSGSSEHVSVHVTARRATDPPSELPPTVVLHEGLTGHNVLDSGGNNRWGDYHGVALDPVDSVTLWLYGAYAKTTDKWGTVIGALRI